MKQMRDFPKDKGNYCCDFYQEANQVLEDQREPLVTEVTSEVWRRGEQVYDVRRELSLQALHAEDASQQQQHQEYAGLHRLFDRIRSGKTAIPRDV